MLKDDITIEEIAAIRYNEGREDGREEGLEKGWEGCRAERDRTIAMNLLAEGATPEYVQKITGLDLETIQSLTHPT